MRVAFFGGSFNPPHIGHVLAASYACSVGFDKVLAVVVHQHAFAKELEAFDHRVAMAELAFAQLPSVEVSRIEATLPSPNYTLHTLRALMAAHPCWQMRLLIGSDVLGEKASWHGFEEIQRIAPPYLLGRSGHASAAASEQLLLPQVSSTEVRHRLTAPRDEQQQAWLDRHVPAAVLRYIGEHQLFAGEIARVAPAAGPAKDPL